MEIDKQIQLRPRFERITQESMNVISERVVNLNKNLKPRFYIKQLDEHLWIYVGNDYKKYYSPHLHIEFEPQENGETKVKGLFGPDPGLWTLFMFLHFVVAGIFIIFGVFAYSNWSLEQPFAIHIAVMSLMVIAWFSLYFIARSNRKKGMPQAHQLEGVLNKLLEGGN